MADYFLEGFFPIGSPFAYAKYPAIDLALGEI